MVSVNISVFIFLINKNRTFLTIFTNRFKSDDDNRCLSYIAACLYFDLGARVAMTHDVFYCPQ